MHQTSKKKKKKSHCNSNTKLDIPRFISSISRKNLYICEYTGSTAGLSSLKYQSDGRRHSGALSPAEGAQHLSPVKRETCLKCSTQEKRVWFFFLCGTASAPKESLEKEWAIAAFEKKKKTVQSLRRPTSFSGKSFGAEESTWYFFFFFFRIFWCLRWGLKLHPRAE